MATIAASRVLVETVNGIAIELVPATRTYWAEIADRTVGLKSLTELRRRCRRAGPPPPTDERVLLIERAPRIGWVRDDVAEPIPLSGVRSVGAESVTTRVSGARVVVEIALPSDGRGRVRRVAVPGGVDLYAASPQLEEKLADIERRGRDLLAELRAEWEQTLALDAAPLGHGSGLRSA